MKAKNSFLSAPFALKLVGFILVFSSLLDYLFLLNGLGDFKDKQTLGTGITQLVDRGVIPMIGIALILAAYWMERLAEMPARNSKLFRFIALAIAALLGVGFLLLAPVHLNNTSQVAQDARDQIGKQAKDAEGQVEQQVQQRQAELTNLVKDTKQFDEQLKQMGEAIANSGTNQMPPAQLEQLKQLEKDLKEIKANPAALQNKAKESRDQLLNRIRDEKQKAEKQVASQAWKASVKTGLNSLILSVGYLIISWVGLSEMGLFSGDTKARRAPKP
jgi:ABC-type multidrug transport system fused ATPase/permease subunit